jgi:hypothetical protein
LYNTYIQIQFIGFPFVLTIALLIIANVPVLVISSFKGAWIGGVPGKKLIRKDTDLNKHGILQIYT